MADSIEIVIEDEPTKQQPVKRQTAAALKKPSAGPTPFQVSLASYTLHPWTSRNADLSQWFNYDLNPASWTQYCIEQMRIWNNGHNRNETNDAATGP